MHNQFVVYLLQYCPQKISVCFGCRNTLKPGGFIGNSPMDLVIVSHMARSWVQDNQVFSKHANVYFHYQQQCVQKKLIFKPTCFASFLIRSCHLGKRTQTLYNQTLASIELYYMGNRFSFCYKLHNN